MLAAMRRGFVAGEEVQPSAGGGAQRSRRLRRELPKSAAPSNHDRWSNSHHGLAPDGGARPNARQNDQINPSTTIPTTPGTGSRPQLASILREGRKSANIHLSSGVIWGTPDN